MSAFRRRGGTPPPVFWLLASLFVLSLGVCSMFAFVPLYVRRHGGGAVAIAAFVAGPMLANAIAVVPAGRLVDRVGRRPVLLASLAGYAVMSAPLAFDQGPLWLLGAVRAGQGLFGGAFNPAMRSTLADLTPPEQRAERFGMSQSVFMAGLLLGPAAGGALAAVQQSLVFICSGAAAGIAWLLVALRVPETRELALAAAAAHPVAADAGVAQPWWRRRGVMVPMLGLSTMGLVMTMYDVVWPLYLTSRGQGTVVIGLSITLYAVPLLTLSRRGGRLADRGNRRIILGANFAVAAATAMSYPFLHSLALILIVGLVEAVSWVTTEPLLYAVLTDATRPEARGRAMAAGGVAEFAGSAVGALALGSLFGVGQGIPFWTAAGVLAVAGALCAVLVPAQAAARALALGDDAKTGPLAASVLEHGDDRGRPDVDRPVLGGQLGEPVGPR